MNDSTTILWKSCNLNRCQIILWKIMAKILPYVSICLINRRWARYRRTMPSGPLLPRGHFCPPFLPLRNLQQPDWPVELYRMPCGLLLQWEHNIVRNFPMPDWVLLSQWNQACQWISMSQGHLPGHFHGTKWIWLSPLHGWLLLWNPRAQCCLRTMLSRYRIYLIHLHLTLIRVGLPYYSWPF